MSEVIKPIVYSFAEQIYPDGTNRERLLLSTKKWLDVHWNSGVLRPIASDTLVRFAFIIIYFIIILIFKSGYS